MLTRQKSFKNLVKYIKNLFSAWKFILFFIWLVADFLSPVYAVDVTLQWFPNSESILAGYRVYYREEGQNYDFVNPDWEGTDASCTLYGLDDNKIYYFVTRAFDFYGNESANSNEVSYSNISSPSNFCKGDFDNDSDVDELDLEVISEEFGRTNCDSAPLCEGDFDTDNNVDGSDLEAFSADFGRTDCS